MRGSRGEGADDADCVKLFIALFRHGICDVACFVCSVKTCTQTPVRELIKEASHTMVLCMHDIWHPEEGEKSLTGSKTRPRNSLSRCSNSQYVPFHIKEF